MRDICAVILEQHDDFRRRFAKLDEYRTRSGVSLAPLWQSLADGLDRHASTEERCFYPAVLACGRRGVEETRDAIGDHDEIRAAVRAAEAASVGSPEWWDAVLRAREANSKHMAEEERGALADFRVTVDPAHRVDLGAAFEAEFGRITFDEDVHAHVDPERYIQSHRQK
jgi:hypothetical protein